MGRPIQLQILSEMTDGIRTVVMSHQNSYLSLLDLGFDSLHGLNKNGSLLLDSDGFKGGLYDCRPVVDSFLRDDDLPHGLDLRWGGVGIRDGRPLDLDCGVVWQVGDIRLPDWLNVLDLPAQQLIFSVVEANVSAKDRGVVASDRSPVSRSTSV